MHFNSIGIAFRVLWKSSARARCVAHAMIMMEMRAARAQYPDCAQITPKHFYSIEGGVKKLFGCFGAKAFQ